MAVVGSEQATRQAAELAEAVVTGETSERASGIRLLCPGGQYCVLVEDVVVCSGGGGQAGHDGWSWRRGEHTTTRVIACVDH